MLGTQLVSRTMEMLCAHRQAVVDQWQIYAQAITAALPEIRRCRGLFRPCPGLSYYLSVDRILRFPGRMTFAIRHRGQDVAEMIIRGNSVALDISSKQQQANLKYFQVNSPAGCYRWKDSPEAREFRRSFRDSTVPHGRSPEHACENRFLKELAKKDRNSKFGGTFFGIRAVTIEGFPLQFPLPVSGEGGHLRYQRGNIDILARIGHGQNVQLIVLELKRPRAYSHVLKQAIIYGTALSFLLRDPGIGPLWWRIFGFRRMLPLELEVKVAAAVSVECRNQYTAEIAELFPNSSPRNVQMHPGLLACGGLFYVENGPSITIEESNF